MNYYCDDCGNLVVWPLFGEDYETADGRETTELISDCCKSTVHTKDFTEDMFSVPEYEYYALIELAQAELDRQLNNLQNEPKLLLPDRKKELIALAEKSGLDQTDWYKEFLNDLNTL